MHPEVPEEQAYFDHALDLRDRLEANLDRAASLSADPKTATDLRRRVGALGVVDPGQGVAFGRIDVGEQRWYIGRGAIWDENNELLVVNWQAPVAAPFYTARPGNPEGLDARRIYRCRDNRILDIEELVFNGVAKAVATGQPPEPIRSGPGYGPPRAHSQGQNESDEGELEDEEDDGLPAHLAEEDECRVPVITDVLLEELNRERSGALADIVATIQSEQYDVISRDTDQLLIVQGGPGTGKTVVGLHRASWLLYNFRHKLRSQDILIIGPNPAFLRYISAVLPSLGEGAVVQLPVSSLGPRVRLDGFDRPAVRKLKGDRRMLRLLLRGLRNRQRIRRGAVELVVEGRRVTIQGEELVARARQLSGTPHNESRRALRTFLIDEVQQQLRSRSSRDPALANLTVQGAAARDIDNYLERVWPQLTPQTFLVDLFGTRRQLEAAAVGLLSDAEVDLLSVPRDVSLADKTWSIDDVALLDLADSLLNGSPSTYEYIVVDEAQDLSPMQYETIRRRSRKGWMTVLGDLAQATSPWAPSSWEEVAMQLRRDGVPTEIAELRLGYRLPSEVHDVAMRLLPSVAPGLRAPEPVRRSGQEVDCVAAWPDELADAVVRTVRSLPETGLVGVVTAQQDRVLVTKALDAEGLSWAPELETAASPITVLGAEETKGLEFDNVVVVEPAHVTDESPQGLRALFVALTRPTCQLSLVHAEPLPDALALNSPLPHLHPEPAPEPEPEPDTIIDLPPEPVRSGPGYGRSDAHSQGQNGKGEGDPFGAVDYEVAAAIAVKLTEALTRYAQPNLAPKVIQQMAELLRDESQNGH